MVPLSLVVCLSLLALAGATDVKQCAGSTFEDLQENVQLTPCKKLPCKLKKGTDQHITITFVPEQDVDSIKNHVTARVAILDVPFFGVDGTTICDKVYTPDGTKASCPLKAGTKYVYKDKFPVLDEYPTISTVVHWELIGGTYKMACFEVPVAIRS